MLDIDKLNKENHRITELAKVLGAMIDDRGICDTSVANDLFFAYVDSVMQHLRVEETELYQVMLTHNDNHVRNLAKRFLSGSGEIKRVFNQYLKRWCRNKKLYIGDHEKFLKDSEEMFEMIYKRVVDETEHLYPAFRKVVEKKAAA
jgi:translation initiation factor 2 alpha subunit (eIF-2alpha)